MRFVLFFICAIHSVLLFSQDYKSFTQTIQKLKKTSTAEEANSLWTELTSKEAIPLTYKDSVAFLYKGEATSVMWVGDFNEWGSNAQRNKKGERIVNTDIWLLKASFPEDARLDYKIVINETNWILDPLNPDQQWSGVGGGSPNSELRMPQWKEDPVTTAPLQGVKPGRLEKDILYFSKLQGYQVSYSVYLPHGYSSNSVYPIIYVTDGYEYMHEQMGNMIIVLNNLIHLQKIQPIIAVFIDHREPADRSNNRRMPELAMNEKFLSFITKELIPLVEKKYTVSTDPGQRAIIGTSMGGLASAYIAFSKPEFFGLAGIQSPAFWFKPEIYSLCENLQTPPIKKPLCQPVKFLTPRKEVEK
ncbi:MAG: esterase family protein [Cyclobacteriaceae bacterium]|nr:esterase family protein [Cyclobacteriaceae bacterium]